MVDQPCKRVYTVAKKEICMSRKEEVVLKVTNGIVDAMNIGSRDAKMGIEVESPDAQVTPAVVLRKKSFNILLASEKCWQTSVL